jgi:hypothetical protein
MSKDVQSGLVHIGSMKSFRVLQIFAEQRGYDEWFHRWMEPQWFAWFIALLKESSDDPLLFPAGKWATIQHMEELLAEAAKAELAPAPPQEKP